MTICVMPVVHMTHEDMALHFAERDYLDGRLTAAEFEDRVWRILHGEYFDHVGGMPAPRT